jgi:hypothetical protein
MPKGVGFGGISKKMETNTIFHILSQWKPHVFDQ